MFFEVIIPFFDRLGTIDTFCDFFYYTSNPQLSP